MPVITGISPSLRRPQTFHTKQYLQGGRALTPLPQRALLIGTMKGGTAVAGTIYAIDDAPQTDALFGVGSPLALMCRKAFECCAFFGQGPFLFAIGVAEPGGVNTQRVQTLTFSGPATGSGQNVFRIAGRTFTVGVAKDESANSMAAAADAAIDAAKQNLPLTAAVAGAVVTTTHVAKGENGQDALIEVVSLAPGVGLVIAQTTAGSGVMDPTAALAAAAGPEYDAIALENHKAADIALALTHVTTAWGAAEKKWRWVVFGETGSIGTATTLAAAANDRAILVLDCEQSPSLPCELAVAGAIAKLAKARPNANWDGMKLPIYPPPDAFDFTNSEVESALAAGITPLKAVVDPQTRVQQPGVVAIQKYVTTKTTEAGVPFEALRDLAVPRVGAYIARQIDTAFVQRFGAAANPDGVLLTDDTIGQIRDMVANLLYAAQDARIITNVDTDLQSLVVEKDLASPGRVNVDVTYTVVLGLHQVAFVHRVVI